MKKLKIRIFKENNVEINLDIIIKHLNKISKNINFILGEHEFFINTDKITSKSVKEVKQQHENEIKNDMITLFITNKPYEDNYFFHSEQNTIGKVYLLSLAHWNSYTSYSKDTGVYYYIIDLLSLYIDNTVRHRNDGIKDCVYGFRGDKTDIHSAIDSALICEACQERILQIDDHEKNDILNDVINLLEELKKANLYNNIVEYWHNTKKEKVKLFFSYAHNDREYLDEFKDYIKIFERNGLVERWDDNELIVGEKWDNTIKDKIYSADIIIFLLSASSLASDYIYNNELKIAFELNEIDEAHVIPIIIKDCLWDMTEFKDFQILPRDGKAINSWKLREEAWTATARGLKKAIDSIISAKQQSIKSVNDNQKSSKLEKVIESIKQTDTNKEIVLKFLKTYHRWWFNIPRIINWGSEREGFARLKSLSHEELKSILSELEKEDKIISKPSSKNKNSLLYKAK